MKRDGSTLDHKTLEEMRRMAVGTVAFDAAEAEGKTLSSDAAIAEMDRWLARPA